MSWKTSIQIFLLIILLIISYLFINIFFLKNKNIVKKEIDFEKTTKLDLSKKKINNLIEDLEYESSDKRGNKYMIKSKYGELNIEDENILILQDVESEIKLVGKPPIYIYSKYAEYNKDNFDTKFYENIVVNFEENNIKSDNLDLFFKDNFASIYNNISLLYEMTLMQADKIKVDLLTGNINVSMLNNKDKILVLGEQ